MAVLATWKLLTPCQWRCNTCCVTAARESFNEYVFAYQNLLQLCAQSLAVSQDCNPFVVALTLPQDSLARNKTPWTLGPSLNTRTQSLPAIHRLYNSPHHLPQPRLRLVTTDCKAAQTLLVL